MIPSLHITKIEPGHYQGALEHSGETLAEFHEASIAAIILDAAKVPEIKAMHIWYEGVSIGTKSTEDMRYWAQVFAQDLIDLQTRFGRWQERSFETE